MALSAQTPTLTPSLTLQGQGPGIQRTIQIHPGWYRPTAPETLLPVLVKKLKRLLIPHFRIVTNTRVLCKDIQDNNLSFVPMKPVLCMGRHKDQRSSVYWMIFPANSNKTLAFNDIVDLVHGMHGLCVYLSFSQPYDTRLETLCIQKSCKVFVFSYC